MRLFLRVVRQRRWIRQPDEDWLEDGELKGDALSDLNTQDGRLSVYTVSSEADKQQVAVAVAATRQNFSNMDYVVFSDSDLERFGITVQQTPGGTPDSRVNDLHYELGKLTVDRLVQLATIISVETPKRILEKRIKILLLEAVSTGQLNNTNAMSQKMREKLEL